MNIKPAHHLRLPSNKSKFDACALTAGTPAGQLMTTKDDDGPLARAAAAASSEHRSGRARLMKEGLGQSWFPAQSTPHLFESQCRKSQPDALDVPTRGSGFSYKSPKSSLQGVPPSDLVGACFRSTAFESAGKNSQCVFDEVSDPWLQWQIGPNGAVVTAVDLYASQGCWVKSFDTRKQSCEQKREKWHIPRDARATVLVGESFDRDICSSSDGATGCPEEETDKTDYQECEAVTIGGSGAHRLEHESDYVHEHKLVPLAMPPEREYHKEFTGTDAEVERLERRLPEGFASSSEHGQDLRVAGEGEEGGSAHYNKEALKPRRLRVHCMAMPNQLPKHNIFGSLKAAQVVVQQKKVAGLPQSLHFSFIQTLGYTQRRLMHEPLLGAEKLEVKIKTGPRCLSRLDLFNVEGVGWLKDAIVFIDDHFIGTLNPKDAPNTYHSSIIEKGKDGTYPKVRVKGDVAKFYSGRFTLQIPLSHVRGQTVKIKLARAGRGRISLCGLQIYENLNDMQCKRSVVPPQVDSYFSLKRVPLGVDPMTGSSMTMITRLSELGRQEDAVPEDGDRARGVEGDETVVEGDSEDAEQDRTDAVEQDASDGETIVGNNSVVQEQQREQVVELLSAEADAERQGGEDSNLGSTSSSIDVAETKKQERTSTVDETRSASPLLVETGSLSSSSISSSRAPSGSTLVETRRSKDVGNNVGNTISTYLSFLHWTDEETDAFFASTDVKNAIREAVLEEYAENCEGVDLVFTDPATNSTTTQTLPALLAEDIEKVEFYDASAQVALLQQKTRTFTVSRRNKTLVHDDQKTSSPIVEKTNVLEEGQEHGKPRDYMVEEEQKPNGRAAVAELAINNRQFSGTKVSLLEEHQSQEELQLTSTTRSSDGEVPPVVVAHVEVKLKPDTVPRALCGGLQPPMDFDYSKISRDRTSLGDSGAGPFADTVAEKVKLALTGGQNGTNVYIAGGVHDGWFFWDELKKETLNYVYSGVPLTALFLVTEANTNREQCLYINAASGTAWTRFGEPVDNWSFARCFQSRGRRVASTPKFVAKASDAEGDASADVTKTFKIYESNDVSGKAIVSGNYGKRVEPVVDVNKPPESMSAEIPPLFCDKWVHKVAIHGKCFCSNVTWALSEVECPGWFSEP
ncbi:unnamed protein product [Amoebophrya sp. A25]|nr:unnamed protein product [Amoebophrya sp. A25]|eukprot:GSA25T00006668001.1